jgi:hypothetical protein
MLMPRHYAMLLATPCAMPLMPSPRCAIFRRFFAAADLRYYFSALFSLPLMPMLAPYFRRCRHFAFAIARRWRRYAMSMLALRFSLTRHAILLTDYLCCPDYAAFMAAAAAAAISCLPRDMLYAAAILPAAREQL